jgi:uncharacterized protein YfiM (DUF2279 family)
MMIRSSLVVALFYAGLSCHAQSDSVKLNKKKLNRLIIGSSVVYGGTLLALNELWYKDSERQSFRFFNDNAEWKQVDKAGHFYSAFYLSYATSKTLQGCEVKEVKADLWGTLTGFALLVPIEIFDGLSADYGASAGDLLFDAAGAAFYLGQKRVWNEIRIHPKFSFRQTRYAAQRPDLLGDGMPSEIFKDYNGQTYWLSIDVDKFTRFPTWLNFAAGYGAAGMVYARDEQNIGAGLESPYRQFYFSLDPDLTTIKTRSKVVRTILFVANMIKLPSPTLEFSKKGTTFHILYF